MRIRTWEADTFTLRVPVIDEATNEGLDMAGATVVAWAQRRGGEPIPAAAVIGGSSIILSFAPESFTPDEYQVQVRVTKEGEVQTVLDETFIVRRSLRPVV